MRKLLLVMVLGAAGLAGGAMAADGSGGVPANKIHIKSQNTTLPYLDREKAGVSWVVSEYLVRVNEWIDCPWYSEWKETRSDSDDDVWVNGVRQVLSDLEWLRDNLSDGPNREALAQEIAVLIDALTIDLG